MKNLLALFALLSTSLLGASQDLAKFKSYNPEEDAAKEIGKAVIQAKAEGKHVFIQVGGNWCIWCARFDDVIAKDQKLDSTLRADYVVYHLNYSKENFNAKLLAKYRYPQRFGFPVFLVLDANGELLHTQNSGYLEDGKKSYDHDKIEGFFTDWSPAALDSGQYKEQ